MRSRVLAVLAVLLLAGGDLHTGLIGLCYGWSSRLQRSGYRQQSFSDSAGAKHITGTRSCRFCARMASNGDETSSRDDDNALSSDSDSDSDADDSYVVKSVDKTKGNRTFDDLSEEEMEEIMALALGEDHKKALATKVETVLQDDWDYTQGVHSLPRKDLPLKANIDITSYHARQAFVKGNFSQAEDLYVMIRDMAIALFCWYLM